MTRLLLLEERVATLSQIESYPQTPLTPAEREKVREILTYPGGYLTRSWVERALDELVGVELSAVRADIDEWDALGFTTEKIRPTSGDGLDYDLERDKSVVRRRLASRLGMTSIALGGLGSRIYRG